MKKLKLFLVFVSCCTGTIHAQLNCDIIPTKDILVQFQPGVDVPTFAAKMEAQLPGFTGLKLKKKVAPRFGYYLLTFQYDPAVISMPDFLQSQPQVISASWNERVQWRDSIPNDPLFDGQWDMERIELPKVWSISTGGTTILGDTIVIAVMDKGFDIFHPDLVDNMWNNPGEIPGDGIDNDGNGYVDDIHGWNFRFGSPVYTVEKHGTWVSGILGAKGNNAKGPAGTNWNVKLMYLGVDFVDEVVSAFAYVHDMRERYNNSNGQEGAFVVVTNGSFGIDKTPCEAQPQWGAMYDPLGEVGVLSVAATANENWDVDELGDIPTSCTSEFLISVTNTDQDDNKVTNAAWGLQSIDLGAPGKNTSTTTTQNQYKTDFGGTSSACPHVAGSVALLYSLPCTDLITLAKSQPIEAARLVRDAIFEGTDPVADLQDKTVTGGRLNVYNAMEYLHSYCIARTGERSAGNFKEIYFSGKNIIRLYPNPVTESLFIDYGTDGFNTFTVRVFNALGEEVRFPATRETMPFNGQILELDVSDWASGTYFISISGNEKSVARKFVKL